MVVVAMPATFKTLFRLNPLVNGAMPIGRDRGGFLIMVKAFLRRRGAMSSQLPLQLVRLVTIVRYYLNQVYLGFAP